jgi:Protein of unknown function (DUF3037)
MKEETGQLTQEGLERHYAYQVLRYSPNLVRDEWVNIGVLLFDPISGERRLRLIDEPEEYARVRRLHRDLDEPVLRDLRGGLEERFAAARAANGAGNGGSRGAALTELLKKWDEVLSNAVQLAPPKGVLAEDLDAELERLYADHVALPPRRAPVGAPGTRPQMRGYCQQVFRQARIWDRIAKFVPVAEYTFPGDPMKIDYSYRRNGTRGFVHTISVTRSPGATKELAYTAGRIAAKAALKTEFAAITDVVLNRANERDRFVESTLRDAGVEPVALQEFAVWVAKLKATMQ